MQVTRQRIINFLRKQGQATVEELAETVDLTPMAVRHHLNVLQAENLVEVSRTRRDCKPGRPVQVYGMSDHAKTLYPQDYFRLTDFLLEEVNSRLGSEVVNDIFNNIARRLVTEVPMPAGHISFEERLNQLVTFLNERGFTVEWTKEGQQYVIHHVACPYRQLAQRHREVCLLDEQVISIMLQQTPVRVSCIAGNDDRCTYFVSEPANGSRPIPLLVQ